MLPLFGAEVFVGPVPQQTSSTVSPGRGAVAIEIKAASRFGDRDLAGLEAFKAQTPGVRAGILGYNGTEALSLGGGLFAVPLGLLLS